MTCATPYRGTVALTTPSRLRPRRVAGVLLLLGLLGSLGLAGAAPASAHARFLDSDPADGAALAELPPSVVLTYSEQIAPEFVDAAVVDPMGALVPAPAVADGAAVTVSVADAAGVTSAAGTWSLVVRVVSTDGHPVEHQVGFVVEGGPAASPDPTGTRPARSEAATPPDPTIEDAAEPSPDETSVVGSPVATLSDGLPGWVGVVLAVGLVGAAAAALTVHLRRRPPADGPPRG